MAQSILDLAKKLNKVIEEELDLSKSNEVNGKRSGKQSTNCGCVFQDCKRKAIGQAANGYFYCEEHFERYK